MEYQRHLDEYASEYYLTYARNAGENWGDRASAEIYLAKYWLDKTEYERIWRGIQNSVFNKSADHFPENMFLKNFELIPNVGGTLFTEKTLKSLQMCLRETGDQNFVIIQNDFGKENPVAFKMKYPSEISWKEIMSGNYISTALFEKFHDEYFVFGESGSWGRYVINDASPPLDITGVKHKFISVFLEKYENLRDAYESIPNSYKSSEVIDALPESYKVEYVIH